MTVVCVDDHPVMLKGLLQNIRQALPLASIESFLNADEAVAFTKQNRTAATF